ncbi:MAG: low molecular weight protein-tyrosine-phosphatase [Trueperaceae bacterium]
MSGDARRARSVLFVCTGNICRSPTAEGVLRTLAARSGLTLEIDSAGLLGAHAGAPPDPRAQSAAVRRGYDLGALRARRLEPEDLDAYDHVWVMDRGHLNQLNRRFGARPNVHLFLAATAPDGVRAREVPDPYLGEAAAFETVLDLVEAGCRAAVAAWRTPDEGSDPSSDAPSDLGA